MAADPDVIRKSRNVPIQTTPIQTTPIQAAPIAPTAMAAASQVPAIAISPIVTTGEGMRLRPITNANAARIKPTAAHPATICAASISFTKTPPL